MEARSHSGLAASYHATGEENLARQHWEHALTGYLSLGVPEAEQARATLDKLSGTPAAGPAGE